MAIDLLVDVRLLVIQSWGEDAEPAVEIVHESLIQGWPTLRRWLDEMQEDRAFLEHARNAARQWDGRGRPIWLLWTGEAADEARLFSRRYRGELGRLEDEYLAAVVDRATRVASRRRGLVVTAFAFLLALIAAAGIALVSIQNAEKVAREQRVVAEAEKPCGRARGQLSPFPPLEPRLNQSFTEPRKADASRTSLVTVSWLCLNSSE